MPIIAGQSCFRDKLEDDVLDISLMQLTEVPVDELALLPKGTTLDMSNNLLVRLPENFPTLMHLIKLDLSKNQLAELPEYFGQLKNLRHLDLYSNQLARLPLSFAQLTRLKWLDLKNNPLVAALQQAAGPCITAEECQQCAKKVVNLMQNMQIQMEKERQRIAMEQRQEEERRGLLEEKERQKIRAEKKAAKERRKQLTKVKAEEAQNSGPYETPGVVPDPSHGILQHDGHFSSGAVGSTTKHKVARQDGFCRSLLTLVFMAFMVVAGAGISMIWIYTGGRLDQPSIERAIPVMWRDIDAWTTNANQKMFVLIRELQAQIQPIWDSLMEKFRWLVEELDRLSGVLVQKLDENLSPTIFSFKEYLWKQLRHVKAHLSEAWTFARPSVLGLRDKMFEYFEILKHNSEFYLPKVFDFVWECCSRCISWVQSTVSDLYE